MKRLLPVLMGFALVLLGMQQAQAWKREDLKSPVEVALGPTSSANNAYVGQGDIHIKCSPDSSIPEVRVKYVGAYFSLSNFNRETELAKAQIIPYFYEFPDEVFTLRLSDKKNYRHTKYRHAKGVAKYSQGVVRKTTISKYLVVHNNVNIRRGPGSRYPLTAKPITKGTEFIGRGPIQDRDGRKWLQVIRNEEVIGYSASRLFKKLPTIAHPPTYNLDCRKDNLEEKFRNSAKAFPQFDVRVISPTPDDSSSYRIKLTDGMKPLPVERKWSEGGKVKLQEINELLGALFRYYQQTIKGKSGNGIKFVFNKNTLDIGKGVELELPGQFLAASPVSETGTRQASRSEQGQPEPKFTNKLFIRVEPRDLLLREEPSLDSPKSTQVLRNQTIVVIESENQEWWQYRHYDARTHITGSVIGYLWVGKPTPIKEDRSNRRNPQAKATFVKDRFQGKRHVILITDAKAFGGKTGRNIKGTLIDWLFELKKKGSKKPVTVMQIRDDGTIKTVIRAEDLKGLKKSSTSNNERSIRRLVSRVSFTGEGFRPLEHLVDFEAKIGSDLKSVLFITTSNGIPDDQFVRNSQLGTTLGWSADKNVTFKVYSTGRCDFWTRKARANGCTTLKKKGANLKSLLAAIYIPEPFVVVKKTPKVKPKPPVVAKVTPKKTTPKSPAQSISASGFFVSRFGHVITNEHVVRGCKRVTVGDNAKKQSPVTVEETDRRNDLALLKLSTLTMASAETKSLIRKLGIKVVPLASDGLLRSEDVQLGEEVMVAGYPYGDIFSNTIKVTGGMVSAVRGMGDDSGQFQLDAAVQPGNSGGPIYDANGNIVGVVVSQLDRLKVAKRIGSLPENVNFGIKASTVRQFLTATGLPSKWSRRSKSISKIELAKIAQKQTLMVVCHQ